MKTNNVLNGISSKPFTELSHAIWRRFRGKTYRVISVPKGMEVTDDGFKVTEVIPTIAMMDVFSEFGRTKIASGTKVPHGTVVAKYAVGGLEKKVGLLAFDTTPWDISNSWGEWVAMEHALADMVKIQQQYHNVTALNLSVGVDYSFEELNEMFYWEKFTPSNIKEKKEKLLELLWDYNDTKIGLACLMIQSLNKLVDEGVAVYLASGNKSDKGVDLLSLSKAQHIVSDPNYKQSNTLFSTDHAPGIHEFSRNYDPDGNLLNVSDGRISFLPEEVVTKRTRRRHPLLALFFPEKSHTIKGTSFASPVKLNEDLKKQMDTESNV